jgi:pseudaminic acid synthase
VTRTIKIGNKIIGSGHPTYVIAEMSANHHQDFDQAVKIIEVAQKAGADAIKLQTYTPDTITINCDNEYFQIGTGTIWEGRSLYGLYDEAYMQWDWQPRLKKIADDLGIQLFSSPFDRAAVNFLEKMNVPAYKIASFEIVDFPLLTRVAQTGKPVILSTGMATLAEIDEALQILRNAGCQECALLKCTSAYPAMPDEMNLRTIPNLIDIFGFPVGLSDHTLGIAVPVAAVALGACIVEKHLTLSRSIPGPDTAFSLEPVEFEAMVNAVRTAEKSLGSVSYNVLENEEANRIFRRSLFVVKDMKAGETFTEETVRSIRPSHGLHPRYMQDIIGRKAGSDIKAGTPLTWSMVS